MANSWENTVNMCVNIFLIILQEKNITSNFAIEIYSQRNHDKSALKMKRKRLS